MADEASRSTANDPWTTWFFRLVQIGGLGVILHEVVGREGERPWVLLTAWAMLLGAIGLQLIVRAFVSIKGAGD